MTSPYPLQYVWFLTGSQSLYGPQTLEQVEAQSRQVVAGLNAAGLPVEVVWKPVVTTKDAIRRALLEANSDDTCIGVIAWMHTFSPAKMWIAGLDALGKPLLHLHTQAEARLPWATIDMDFMNLNQAAHGDREFGYLQTRLGVARATVVGHVSSPQVRARIASWQRAAAGCAAVRNLSLVRFGDNMRDVAVTEGDKVEAELTFGVSVNTYGVSHIADAVGQVTDSEAAQVAGAYEDIYLVAPELRRGGARHASLLYAAKQEIALRSFLETHHAGAFTDTFEDLGALRQLPGLAVQRLMAAGYGFGAEGDWKTAMLVRAAKVMGQGLPGGASLMEDYTYHLVPGEEKILGAHMLEVCPSLTSGPISCEIHPLSIGGREDPVRLVFDADPGPGVVVGMADMRDRFRLTVNTVDICGPDEPMPRLPVGRAVWRPQPSLCESATAWLMAGAPHHTAMSTATDVQVWRDFAAMSGTELVVIDSGTRLAELERELRMNQVYYRMARGV